MRLTVTRTSRFGFQAEGQEGWYNADKFAAPAPDFSGLHAGDTIEAVVNGRYVRSFSVVANGAAPSQAIPSSHEHGNTANGNNRNDTITRLAVIRSVLTATSVFTENTRDRLIVKYVEYALTGIMPSVPITENHLASTPSVDTTSRLGNIEVALYPSAPTEPTQPVRRGRPRNTPANGSELV